MLATYDFYDKNFSAVLTEEEWDRYARRATYFIENNCDLPEKPDEDLLFREQLCCCEVAEAIKRNESKITTSISNDGYSEHYSIKDSETTLLELLSDYLGDYDNRGRVVFL